MNSSLDTVTGADLRERARHLLCDLVAIPSYGGQEEAAVGYLARRFKTQGIPYRITELDGKPLNVVAEIGDGPRTIILNSHLDTVPPGEQPPWLTDPLTPVEKDGLIYGRGAGDAKGCLAAMIMAFEELAKRRAALPAKVILMAVGAEERGGLGSKIEVAQGLRADAAIVGEPTTLAPMLAHKGVLRLDVEVTGRAAHASDPEAGLNAVVAMAPIVSALDRLATEVRRRSETYTGRASLVISTITGGVALNVIPARCVISIDRRVLPTETDADATREIVEVVNRALPAASGASVEVRKVRFVPPSCTDPKADIVAAAERAVSAVLGRSVQAIGFSATCDMTYLVNDGGIPTVILGPGSIDVAHQANEHIAIDQMALAVQVYLRTIEAWLEHA
ncbi:MAG TPA: M20 family metallopeptidase [Candidatus Methylomirabilis sp.]|nr:M20 family metallopeptidase [Candidatus Methylomirabilis sp.]